MASGSPGLGVALMYETFGHSMPSRESPSPKRLSDPDSLEALEP